MDEVKTIWCAGGCGKELTEDGGYIDTPEGPSCRECAPKIGERFKAEEGGPYD